MADITMCEGTDCYMRDNCYRFTATPSEYRQSYFLVVPLVWRKGECGEYAECSEFWETDCRQTLV